MKVQIIDEFLENDYPKSSVIKYANMSKSSYYYTSTGTKPGRKADDSVYDSSSNYWPIEKIVATIQTLFEGEFVDYGYYKVSKYLQNEIGLKLGKNRVYSIMKKHKLLSFQRDKSKRSSRNWVKELVPQVHTEFSFLEFDIKYVYLQGSKQNALVLSVIDVFSRWLLDHKIALSIKSRDVIEIFKDILKKYPMPKSFVVRNDNGSQFEALEVQNFLKNNGIKQEFTLPATPQQNAHIESYHSIMERAICQRFEFQNLEDFKNTMNRWKNFYNFERIHGGIGFNSPAKYLSILGVSVNQNWKN